MNMAMMLALATERYGGRRALLWGNDYQTTATEGWPGFEIG